MSQASQPETSGTSTPTSASQGNLVAPSPYPPQRIPYWLQQAERFLRVIVRLYLGLVVCFAPWYPPAWDNNPLFSQSPTLSGLVANGAVRGIVSGLGLLNLWIALHEVLRPSSDPYQR